jgi:hypothetical protein
MILVKLTKEAPPMKIGTMTSKEFLTGEGVARLRRQKSAEQLRKKANVIRARAHAQISKLADQCLQQLIPWWHQKFPKRQLKIIFGMGSEYICIDGRSYYPAPFPPYPRAPYDGTHAQIHRRNKLNWPMFVPPEVFFTLDQALRDVDDITTGHRDGLPEDFVIEPIKKRGTP